VGVFDFGSGDALVDLLESFPGMCCATSTGMTKNNTDKAASSKPNEELNPLNPPTVGPASIKPTAAEYERDAKLEQEKREAAEKKAKEVNDAMQKGDLPPGAQTLEEAKKAQAEREKAAKEGTP
jgi:hypothetical protein